MKIYIYINKIQRTKMRELKEKSKRAREQVSVRRIDFNCLIFSFVLYLIKYIYEREREIFSKLNL